MRAFKLLLCATVFICFILGTSAQAADVIKIGVVDFQRIFELSEGGKAAQDEIKKQGDQLTADLQGKNDELEEIRKRLEREALVMDKDMREEKERELRIKTNDFKLLERKYRDDIQSLNLRLVNRLQKEIIKHLEEIGKKEGYTLILEKKEAGVVYSPGAIDLTDKIIPLIPGTM